MNQAKRDEILLGLQKGQADHAKEIESVKRGIHGDKENGMPGLMDRQAKDDEKFETYQKQMLAMNTSIHVNTKFRKKISKATKVSGWTGGAGGIVAIIAFFKQIKEALAAFFN